MLFEVKDRKSNHPCGWTEPKIEFLDRSASPIESRVRSLMNEWYMQYPEDSRASLRGRFWAKTDQQHYGAVTELFIYALFLNLGYMINVAPDGPNNESRPDYLLESNCYPSFSLEVTHANYSGEAESLKKYRNIIHDAVSTIHSPDFVLSMDTVRGSDQDPSTGELRRALIRWIEDLGSPELCDLGSPSEFLWDRNGWQVCFSATPRTPDSSEPLLGSVSTGITELNSVMHIRRKVRTKTSKYGQLNGPYVIAVGAHNPYLKTRDIHSALFGTEQLSLEPHLGPAWISRAGDGIFLGPNGPQNTRVSGLIVVKTVDAWNVGSREPIYIENPWAKYPILGLPRVFDRWLVSADRRSVTRHKAEMTVREIFGLPTGWPESAD